MFRAFSYRWMASPGRGGGMAYADGSNPSVRKDMGVRLPSPALRDVRAAWSLAVSRERTRG
jgi:hypothetical protein